MNYNNIFILTIVVFFMSCGNSTLRNKHSQDTPSNTNVKDSTIIAPKSDTLLIDGINFYPRRMKGGPNLENNKTSCHPDFKRILPGDFPDEYKMFTTLINYYEFNGDLPLNINDSAFALKFHEAVTGLEPEYSKIEGLYFERKYNVKFDYLGACTIWSLKYRTPSSATQSAPTILISQGKKIAMLFHFSDMKVQKNLIQLDLNIRNNKHTLYTAQFDSTFESWIPVCYRIEN